MFLSLDIKDFVITCFFINYIDLITKFLVSKKNQKNRVSNDKNIYKIKKNQDKKLYDLCLKSFYHSSVISHDPDKAILNFSGHTLSYHKIFTNYRIKVLQLKCTNYVQPVITL